MSEYGYETSSLKRRTPRRRLARRGEIVGGEVPPPREKTRRLQGKFGQETKV